MEVSFPLALAWAGLLVLAVYIYVILDGFDLGIGMLFAAFKTKQERDVLMNSVAPVWDGNETWLVLGGGGLFAAFPMAYAIIMPALYVPIIAMLLGLVLRGVAFEYRWRTKRWERVWDWAFIGGSATATLSQGIALGALLQGIEVDGRSYGGGWWDWLSPFSLLTGIAVMSGYCLLGATWLNIKTDGALQQRAQTLAWRFFVSTLVFIAAVSLATPFLETAYYARWLSFPGIFLAAPVPIAVSAVAFWLYRTLVQQKREVIPFLLSLVLFGLCFAGLGVSMYPYIIPTEVTILEAATPFKSQIFMFVGAVVMLPIILFYTGYAYWVFRGKIDPNEGYH
ncbi:MAG: cytochrome d ubiquinol oxidase subunit II [Pseudomonadota bacterium]